MKNIENYNKSRIINENKFYKELQVRGLQISPQEAQKLMNIAIAEHDTWEAHMLKDIIDLLQCNAIYMLQGWQESKGACIEHYIATKIRMPIMYEVEKL
nr:MAG TPA: protein of unknown function (DUF4406) [Caudoviricetes sp.]